MLLIYLNWLALYLFALLNIFYELLLIIQFFINNIIIWYHFVLIFCKLIQFNWSLRAQILLLQYFLVVCVVLLILLVLSFLFFFLALIKIDFFIWGNVTYSRLNCLPHFLCFFTKLDRLCRISKILTYLNLVSFLQI